MRSRGPRFLTAVAVLLISLAVPTLGGVAIASPASAGSAPTVPATGHFHSTKPTSLLSVASLPARATRTVQIAGAAGVGPHVRAVAVTVGLRAPTGATSVWLGPGSTKPALATAATSSAATSAFAIVPVSAAGTIRLWNGAHATGLRLGVTGWFSSAAESG